MSSPSAEGGSVRRERLVAPLDQRWEPARPPRRTFPLSGAVQLEVDDARTQGLTEDEIHAGAHAGEYVLENPPADILLPEVY
jgi:hypothetical protein